MTKSQRADGLELRTPWHSGWNSSTPAQLPHWPRRATSINCVCNFQMSSETSFDWTVLYFCQKQILEQPSWGNLMLEWHRKLPKRNTKKNTNIARSWFLKNIRYPVGQPRHFRPNPTWSCASTAASCLQIRESVVSRCFRYLPVTLWDHSCLSVWWISSGYQLDLPFTSPPL